jgi:hypothetical protein
MKKWMPAILASQHVVIWTIASLLLNLGLAVWLIGVVAGLAVGVAGYSLYRLRHRPMRSAARR